MRSITLTWKRATIAATAVIALVLLASAIALRSPRPAPAIQFTLIDGSTLRLKDLRGKPVLVLFWATTCNTCIAKAPELNQLYARLHPKGLEMIAVAMPYDPPARVAEFARLLKIPYPVALDYEANTVRAFGNVRVTPTTFLITADGTVAWRKPGKLDTAHLGVTIEDLLLQSEARY